MVLTQNDSRREAKVVSTVVRALNGIGALVAGGFAVVAWIDPTLVLPGGTGYPGAEFAAEGYAARQLPLTAVLVFLLARPARMGLIPVLVLAGLVQLADVAIGVAWGKPNMVIGGGLLAAIHLITAVWLSRRVESR